MTDREFIEYIRDAAVGAPADSCKTRLLEACERLSCVLDERDSLLQSVGKLRDLLAGSADILGNVARIHASVEAYRRQVKETLFPWEVQ